MKHRRCRNNARRSRAVGVKNQITIKTTMSGPYGTDESPRVNFRWWFGFRRYEWQLDTPSHWDLLLHYAVVRPPFTVPSTCHRATWSMWFVNEHQRARIVSASMSAAHSGGWCQTQITISTRGHLQKEPPQLSNSFTCLVMDYFRCQVTVPCPSQVPTPDSPWIMQ